MLRKSLLLTILLSVLNMASAQPCDSLEGYDLPSWQLKSLGIDVLHANGYTGKGVRIAVLDNGFLNVDQIEGFRDIKVLFQKDIVEKDDDVFGPCDGRCTHGTKVLSVLAARGTGMAGAAPDAEYLLFRTEDDRGESKMEEAYWAEAARLADSLGADILISSLGYLDFDDGSQYAKQELDGRTAISTRAAQRAAQAGILVVTSMGNEGNDGITAPADADSILAVGAVTQDQVITSFSSRGPSGDGRTKPDVVAQGLAVYQLDKEGALTRGNGTSYSAPLVAGLAACLWQAVEAQGLTAEAQDIRRAIIQSSDRVDRSDFNYGYGLPSGAEAFSLLTQKNLPSPAYAKKPLGRCRPLFIQTPLRRKPFSPIGLLGMYLRST